MATPPTPAFPAPPPPEGGYGCPRCHSPHTTEAAAGSRSLALSAMNHTVCNACGYTFDGATGRSNTGKLALVIALPVLVAVVLFGLVFLWMVR